VAWASTTANVSPSPPNAIFVSRSSDKGKTWTTSEVAGFQYTNGSYMQILWSPEGGSDGTVHLVHETTDTPQIAGTRDVSYRRSTDGGRTWSEPKNITDDDPRGLYGQYYPNATLAPNGRIDVAWYDTRNDPGYRSNDVYLASSTDNGETWSKNERITDQVIDRRIGVWSTNYDMATQPSLASTNAYTIVAWDDPRLSDRSVADNTLTGGGLQDIYAANVQFAALGGGTSRAAKIVLAGVIGLLTVGLVLLVMAMAVRGRGGRSPRTTETTERRPARVT
jgi:hypothetical protein